MFCATSALGICWQHLNHLNLLVRSVCRFHVYFHVRIILPHLGISLPHEDGFGKVKNPYIKREYYSICDDYGVNTDETLMNRDWFYTTKYSIFSDKRKPTKRSAPDNLKRSKGFRRKDIEKISRSVISYVYLVLTSQVQGRSVIVGNSASVVDTQQVFKAMYKVLINENCSISADIVRYQSVVEHALSKV